MARYRASVDSNRPQQELFAYLSDFSNAQQWDPGVVEGERLGEGPVGEGTRFRLVAVFLGRRNELIYTIVDLRPHERVTFRGENASVVSLDTITFEPAGGGTRVTYDADLSLKGPLKLLDPLLGLAFGRVGENALAGLRRTIQD